MKRLLKRCAAQVLVLVYYVTGVAYRTGSNGLSMVENLKVWAEK